MNKWLFGLAALIGLGVSAADAQSFRPPIAGGLGIAPFGMGYPGLGGYGGYGGGYGGLGGYGAPYGGMYPQGVYGNNLGRPGFMGPVVPGQFTGGQLQTGNTLGSVLQSDAQLENITGHPTRFNSYSRYFFNQGGSTNYATPEAVSPVFSINGIRNTTVGSRPQVGSGTTPQP